MLLDGRRALPRSASRSRLVGLWWGSLRMDALERSVLSREVGESGQRGARRRPRRLAGRRGRRVSSRRRANFAAPRSRARPPRPAGRTLAAARRHPASVGPRPRAAPRRGRRWLRRARAGSRARASTSSCAATDWRRSVAVAGSRGSAIAFATASSGGRREARAAPGGRSCSASCSARTRGCPTPCRTTSARPGSTTCSPSPGRTSPFIAGGVYGLGWLLRLSRVVRELATLGCDRRATSSRSAGSRRSSAPASRARWRRWPGSPRDRATAGTSLRSERSCCSRGRRRRSSSRGSSSRSRRSPRSSSRVPRAAAHRWTATRCPRALADALAVALVCGLATAPIVLFHFGRGARVHGARERRCVSVAAPLVLGLGLLAAAVDPVSPAAAAGARLARGLGRGVARARGAPLRGAARRADRATDGARRRVSARTVAWLAMRRRRPRIVAARPRSPLLAAGSRSCARRSAWLAARPAPCLAAPGRLRVTFLDVGQGDSVLLETPSARVLVDQGPPEANVAGQLARMGIRSLSRRRPHASRSATTSEGRQT